MWRELTSLFCQILSVNTAYLFIYIIFDFFHQYLIVFSMPSLWAHGQGIVTKGENPGS